MIVRIKLAFLDQDLNYLNRIVNAFTTKYVDKFEIYSFTDMEIALSTVVNNRIDVFVASDSFDVDVTLLPQKCGFAYFVNSNDIENYNEHRTIGKYQKVDLIYKQILSLFSEKASDLSGLRLGDEKSRIVLFTSVAGGAGASTMAAAAAIYHASKGKKTLYLNLETFGSSDLFFEGEGAFDFSDIVFALKSKKTNLPLKLESCVKQDANGVYFYSQSKVALDMRELTVDDTLRLISELELLGTYDLIVVDMNFSLSEYVLKVMKRVHAIILVGDGSEISNAKIYRAYNSICILDETEEEPLKNKMYIIYNKFSTKISQVIDEISIVNIGGAPRYEHATCTQIVEELSKADMFSKII